MASKTNILWGVITTSPFYGFRSKLLISRRWMI